MNGLTPVLECIKNAGDAIAKHGFRPVFREENSIGVLTKNLLAYMPYPAEYHQISESEADAVLARGYAKVFSEVVSCQDEQTHAVDVTVCLLPDTNFNTEQMLSISTRQLQDSHHAVVWCVRTNKCAWRTALNPDFAFEFGDNNELTCLLWLKHWSN